MSRKGKKPGEVVAQKVKNINLLPNILNTEPNQKMLDSTLDVMTSKGQILPFRETYGTRTATNRVEEFFKVETDQVRRESQANNMLALYNTSEEFLGKVSYYDVENYFNVKSAKLVDGVLLDKNINVLDLPIDATKFTDFNLFYWLPKGLPPCRIHQSPSKFSVADDLIGKQYVSVVDEHSGNTLELQNGMVLYFTGIVASEYLTVDTEQPVEFLVSGVGEAIELVKVTETERRSPTEFLEKNTYDNTDLAGLYPGNTYDSDAYDSSTLVSAIEYVVQDGASTNSNGWQIANNWYHISTIKAVAKFLNVNVTAFASSANKAVRPIICFENHIKLYNWPNQIISDVKTILRSDVDRYVGKSSITDSYGYSLQNNDLVIFEDNPSIYRCILNNGAFTFTTIHTPVELDGVILTAPTEKMYHRVVFKNGKWQFAQNKTTKNQTPKFEFYLSNGAEVGTLNETTYQGGVILGFKEGTTYDPVLEKYIDKTGIVFNTNSDDTSVSPQQLIFETDVDAEFSYVDPVSFETLPIKGPYAYEYGYRKVPFYQPRKGLDFTKQIQDILVEKPEDERWSATFDPPTNGFNNIHIFYDTKDGYKFYFDLEGYGLVRFSSKRGFHEVEQMLPLVSSSKVSIKCHNLPAAVTFYRENITNNISTYTVLEAPYVTNNSVTTGTIELDLTPSVLINGSYIDNDLASGDVRLAFTLGSQYKTAFVKNKNDWNFIQHVFLLDSKTPLHNNYDFTVSPVTLEDGSLSYKQQFTETSLLQQATKTGDKIGIASVVYSPTSKTAPLSLTSNPLNEALGEIGYYSLYQHEINIKSNAVDYTKESIVLGGGSIIKHSDPFAKAAIVATNLPFDFGELLVKHGKHYDLFLSKLREEITTVVNTNDYTSLSALDVLNLAISKIFETTISNSLYWAHSNMIGWGSEFDNYTKVDVTVGTTPVTLTSLGFNNISHASGKELILHIVHNGKVLTRSVDYNLTGNTSYTAIEFSSELEGQEVSVFQWNEQFNSFVPASLAKLGLSSVYVPEIYADTSYGNPRYFLVRHDGTRYFLKEGIDGNNYPTNLVDQYLFEYEKAVWSSIAYDVEVNSHAELLENLPGFFRTKSITWDYSRVSVNNEVTQWMLEAGVYSMANTFYNEADGFTLKYQIGSGDGDTVIGSWRAIYQFLYDTDRPHSHPWEMLGYTIKPTWWENSYSWTDPVKRAALENSLRTGNIADPATGETLINPAFARNINLDIPESFPVDADGNLIPPNMLEWLDVSIFGETSNWQIGDMGPIENVFLNSHRGLAADVRKKFLMSPAQYVNNNWVPGQTFINEWGQKLDKTTGFWQQATLEHNYHRQVINDVTNYTGGIESLFVEYCLLHNKDYVTGVIDKFYGPKVKKEFLLSGFTNKADVKIRSISLNNNQNTLVVPEENFQVRTLKHYTEAELFYSGVRIIKDDTRYLITGFSTELGYFPYMPVATGSPTVVHTIGNVNFLEKTSFESNPGYLKYGSTFASRQDIFDFLLGYGKYLEAIGFVFEEPEEGEIRNWLLSAKQFILWSNDNIASGNDIDLNTCANEIKLVTPPGHLDSLEGTDENAGQCVDRQGMPLFSKDLLVSRNDDYITIKTKDPASAIYGIKLSFSTYETVVHLDPVSEFGDVYFNPSQSVEKNSFVIAGKKTQDWQGSLYAPGYIFNDNNLLPNYNSMADVGKNLLDVESTIIDPVIVEASRAQFGLNRNAELRELFLLDENEVAFKTAIPFSKGTQTVFNSLQPLTHPDGSFAIPYEEYMIRTGEIGNTHNIEYYEFELNSQDVKNETQLIKFSNETPTNSEILYVRDNSTKWVHRPINKKLRFNYSNISYGELKTSGPIIDGDTDYSVASLKDLPALYSELADIWSLEWFDRTAIYKKDATCRFAGKLYRATSEFNGALTPAIESIIFGADGSSISPSVALTADQIVYISGTLTSGVTTNVASLTNYSGTLTKFYVVKTSEGKLKLSKVKGSTTTTDWLKAPGAGKTVGLSFNSASNLIAAYFSQIDEPWLPNVFINNYYKTNPDLTNSGTSSFTPGTWQVLQLMDQDLEIDEACPGLTDVSVARISTVTAHNLSVGDYVMIVNCGTAASSANGIWPVKKLEADSTTKFYIDTRITESIPNGKLFVFRPVRFKSTQDKVAALTSNKYSWKRKYLPLTNAVSETSLELQTTPSGYNRTYPIIIVDDSQSANPTAATFDYGNFEVYEIRFGSSVLVKSEQYSMPIDPSDIEHLVVYDYATNQTLAKFELFDPRKLIIPQVLKDEIDITSRIDPAKYNRTTDTFKSIYTSLGWYEEFVGRRWWNTNTTNFNDYESVDEETRAKYWGTTVDGEYPEIYEWTKSTVHPSQWATQVAAGRVIYGQVASGEAYVDTSLNENNYHWVEETDYVDNKEVTTYYFWVKNKTAIAAESVKARTYTVSQLSKTLLNPSAAGISWWAPVTNNTIVIKGVAPYLNTNSTVLQIKKKTKGEDKHHQWTFISENSTASSIPEWVHSRFKDSISARKISTYTESYQGYDPQATYQQGEIVKFGLNNQNKSAFYLCKIDGTAGVDKAPVKNTETDNWKFLDNVTEYLPSDKGNWDGYLYAAHERDEWNSSLAYDAGDIVMRSLPSNSVQTTSVTYYKAKTNVPVSTSITDTNYWTLLVTPPFVLKWDYDEENALSFYRDRNVPDQYNLHIFNRLGNDVRPYPKSWFNNITEARRVFVKKLNEMLININITSLSNWDSSLLNNTAYSITEETYDITQYWEFADFRSTDYDSLKHPAYVVNSLESISSLSASVGDYIKLVESINAYSIYRKNSDNSYSLMFKRNGTIQLMDTLYDESGLSQWGNGQWDQSGVPWSNDLGTVFNAIVEGFRSELFTGIYEKYYSLLLCAMFRYVLSDQVNVDWLAKSSTIEPVNLISKTADANNYLKRDEVNIFLNFFDSIKSYRDKIRSVTINKEVVEQVVVEIDDAVDVSKIVVEPNTATWTVSAETITLIPNTATWSITA